jgi:hypothetical protein
MPAISAHGVSRTFEPERVGQASRGFADDLDLPDYAILNQAGLSERCFVDVH